MAKYGDYNGKLTENEHKEELDVKSTSSTDAVRRTIVSNYTDTDIKQGPYVGYVLRIDEKEGSGWFFDTFGKSWSLKVRIPELDAHIPEPQRFGPDAGAEDVQKIDLHRTYYPKKGKDSPSKPVIGQRVLVDRDMTSSGRDWYLEALNKEGGEAIEPQKEPSKAKNEYKKSKPKTEINQNKNKPTPVNQTELDKWNAYSRNSGNPLNIDIVTKTVNGQKITFSRGTMAKYEKMIDMWESRRKEIEDAGLGDVGQLQYKFGEAFRIWGGFYKDDDKKGKNPFGWGQFRDNSRAPYDESKHPISQQRGTHTAGNAVDMNLSPFYKKVKNKEYLRNYINLMVSCAQQNGFVRFGIGPAGSLHMDTGYRANGQYASPYYWVYGGSAGIGYTSERKKKFYQNGWISKEWVEGVTRYSAPPNLKNWDYMNYRYGPNTRGVG